MGRRSLCCHCTAKSLLLKKNGLGKLRRLHRNLLLSGAIFNSDDQTLKPVLAPRRKSNTPDNGSHRRGGVEVELSPRMRKIGV